MEYLKKILGGIAPLLATALGGPLAGAAVSFIGDKLLGDSNASVESIVTAFKDPAAFVKIKEIDSNFKLEMAKLTAAMDKGQIEINKIEAASDSIFKSGWRPFCAWVCVSAMVVNFIIAPFTVLFGIHLPVLDMGEMMPVLLGLLGLGGLRSYDKRNK